MYDLSQFVTDIDHRKVVWGHEIPILRFYHSNVRQDRATRRTCSYHVQLDEQTKFVIVTYFTVIFLHKNIVSFT